MNEKLTKNQRREQAREQARVARAAEKQREKRNRLLLQGGIALVVVAVLGVVALVLSQSMKPAGPGPLNMISGGVTFTKDLEVVKTKALQDGQERKAPATDRTKTPIDVTVYVDYMCPSCGNFEQQNGGMLEQYVGSGDVNLTVFPLNFLDGQSLGTKYSTRAANALSCLVDQQPESAFAFHNRLLSAEVQPAEQTTGLTDDQLVENAEAAGAEANTELKQCIKDQPFASFISANWKSASETGLLGLADGAQLVNDPRVGDLQPADEPQRLRSTPTVIVNGQQWVDGRDGSLEQYILKIKGELDGSADKSKEDAEEAAG
jgi:protein-disulfide isomerase